MRKSKSKKDIFTNRLCYQEKNCVTNTWDDGDACISLCKRLTTVLGITSTVGQTDTKWPASTLDRLELTGGEMAVVFSASRRRYRGEAADGAVKRASVTTMLTWFLREWCEAIH